MINILNIKEPQRKETNHPTDTWTKYTINKLRGENKSPVNLWTDIQQWRHAHKT